MAQLFPMPQLGSTMEEGTILKWLKREGDSIRKGDTLLEIETDKATMEVESPVDGVVLKLLFDNDSVVAVQRPIAILGTVGESFDHLIGSQPEAGKPAAEPTVQQSDPPPFVASDGLVVSASLPIEHIFLSPRARKFAAERGIPIALLAGRGTGPEGRVVERDVAVLSAELAHHDSETTAIGKARRTTPLAARLADDLGIDLNDLANGLPGSRVRRDDILRHIETAPAHPLLAPAVSLPPSESGSEYSVRPFAGMRKRIADNVSKSRFTAPHVTLTIEVDMTECADMRTRIIPEIEKAFGTRVSFTDILAKASARALEEYPAMNSALVGDELRTYRHKNIGVAVALEEGLVVPVLQDASAKSLGTVSSELKKLIDRARSGKFTPDDIAGGTFTITNLGSYGIDQFDPIIVPPQAGILGVCRIAEKAVVINKQVVIRSMMNLCLSFDHRIVDGAPAAAFLQRLKQLLENPIAILV